MAAAWVVCGLDDLVRACHKPQFIVSYAVPFTIRSSGVGNEPRMMQIHRQQRETNYFGNISHSLRLDE